MDQMPFRLEVNDLLYSDCSKGTLTEFSSPYKLSIYLLLLDIERIQQSEDGLSGNIHTFLGILLTYLIRQRHFSAAFLKCFLVQFLFDKHVKLLSVYFESLHLHKKLSVVPCTDYLFSMKNNPCFARPKSVIGMFARKVQENYAGDDLLFQKHMEHYLVTPLTETEQRVMREKWNWDVDELLLKVSSIEEKFFDKS